MAAKISQQGGQKAIERIGEMPPEDEEFDEKESRLRFEAALRGARIAGPKPMKNAKQKKAKVSIPRKKKVAAPAKRSR